MFLLNRFKWLYGWIWEGDLELHEDFRWSSGIPIAHDCVSPDGVLTIFKNGDWLIRKGFKWNGCSSVPDGPIDPATGYPPTWRGSCVHDCGYGYILLSISFPYSYKQLDGFLRAILSQDGMPIRSWIYWRGVRRFGWSYRWIYGIWSGNKRRKRKLEGAIDAEEDHSDNALSERRGGAR